MSRETPVYAVHCYNDFRPPIALGLIVSNLKANYPELAQRLLFAPGYLPTVDDLLEAVEEYGSGVFLFSDYNWNISTHLKVAAQIKERFPDALMVHGGPSVPRVDQVCAEFLAENPSVDFACHGEGEDIVPELIAAWLDGLPYDDVTGISFLRDGKMVRTGPRERCRDLGRFPSPYLTGEFDSIAQRNRPPAVTIETSRGCPYHCTFCDWGQATLQKINKFPEDRVMAEIEWLARHEVPVIELTDANFGIFDRDVRLIEHLCAVKQETGFPRELATNYAKNATERVTEIVRLSRDAGLVAQGILSLQTRDEDVLKIVQRKNLPTKRYDKLLADFRRLELPVVTEIMMGLPGSTYQTFVHDLQWASDNNVGAYVHSTILLPNTPMAEPAYIDKYKIRTVKDSKFADPKFREDRRLMPLRGNQVVSTSSYDEEDFYRMIRMTCAYHMFQGESVLKHAMFYLRHDHGVPQIRFIEELLANDLTNYPVLDEFRNGEAEPASTIAIHGVGDPMWESVAENKWPQLYDEVERYIDEHYGINSTNDPTFRMVMDVQRFVMAYYGREVPCSREFPHDFAAYFHDHIAGKTERRLRDYGPSALTLRDPLRMCARPERPEFYEPHVGHIELASQLTPARIGFDVKEVIGRPPSTRHFEVTTNA